MWVAVIPKPKFNKAWLWTIGMCVLLFGFYGIFSWWIEVKEERVLETLSVVMTDKVVVIDAGHGGIDPGSIGFNGTIEKDITLAVAKKLEAYLNQSGTKVIMTREDDTMYYDEDAKTLLAKKRQDLSRRVGIANDSKADAFISIHVNSFKEDSRQHGAQTFSQPEFEESYNLSLAIQTKITELLKNTDRKPKEVDGYFINEKTEMPAVIVEIGFSSNPEEEVLLNDEEYQNKLAYSIYAGIVTFFSENN